jgi:hypothetical protein
VSVPSITVGTSGRSKGLEQREHVAMSAVGMDISLITVMMRLVILAIHAGGSDIGMCAGF